MVSLISAFPIIGVSVVIGVVEMDDGDRQIAYATNLADIIKSLSVSLDRGRRQHRGDRVLGQVAKVQTTVAT